MKKVRDLSQSPQQEDTRTIFQTPDLYFAAFLKSRGIFLKGADCRKGRVFFHFQQNGDFDDLMQKYLNDSSIGVLSFKAALQELKSLIFRVKAQASSRENRNAYPV